MNEYNCPDKVLEAMSKRPFLGPLFLAIDVLGPKRIQWGGKDNQWCSWLLDGYKCHENAVYKAAGLERMDALNYGSHETWRREQSSFK